MLDCTVYALAGAYHLGMNKFSERDWTRLEEIVQPITADLFENNVQKAAEKAKKPAKTGEKTHKVKKKTAQKPRRKKTNTGFVARY